MTSGGNDDDAVVGGGDGAASTMLFTLRAAHRTDRGHNKRE